MSEGRIAFVLGGARSGKSRHGLALAEALPSHRRVFVATAQAHDAEMADRIDRHRAERDASWTTVEAPLHPAQALATEAVPGTVVVVDCLTLWLSNLMLAERDVDAAAADLVAAAQAAGGPVVLVANEVGLGIVPDNALARRFRDHAGRLNQQVAAIADLVRFMVAGLPMDLKRPESGPWSGGVL
ncbi:MAG TPA: bifunctional adenosylcobinamide kinase/adenosylcobinamide-phosphate guanylyltransferase [Azospirillaceae bacterium]|nr:bifunctional adenosylcobinamide kinase/adenosylcobinamide-phosphate guanylyltransferase [Azospirillaceae bacterium]